MPEGFHTGTEPARHGLEYETSTQDPRPSRPMARRDVSLGFRHRRSTTEPNVP